MALRLRSFQNLPEIDLFIRGGIRGGRALVKAIYNLHGKTLIFTTPSVTVTFSDPTGEGLGPATVVAQIKAAAASLSPTLLDNCLSVEEVSPSAGVVLSKTGTANTLLGFSYDTSGVAATGVVLAAPGGTAPALVSIGRKATGDGYVVVVDEA